MFFFRLSKKEKKNIVSPDVVIRMLRRSIARPYKIHHTDAPQSTLIDFRTAKRFESSKLNAPRTSLETHCQSHPCNRASLLKYRIRRAEFYRPTKRSIVLRFEYLPKPIGSIFTVPFDFSSNQMVRKRYENRFVSTEANVPLIPT